MDKRLGPGYGGIELMNTAYPQEVSNFQTGSSQQEISAMTPGQFSGVQSLGGFHTSLVSNTSYTSFKAS